MKAMRSLLLACSMIAASFGPSFGSTNIALYKSYKLTPSPNYPLSAPSWDVTSLTDGKYTQGFFWMAKTTVGWQFTPKVEMLLDLGKSSKVEKIVFDTARGIGAGVNYPDHVYAFVGTGNDFLFVGDVVECPANVSGPYQTKKFVMDHLEAAGRYVLLQIVPKGTTVFCDEIEVWGEEGQGGKTGALTIDRTRKKTEEMNAIGDDVFLLRGLIDQLEATAVVKKDWKDRLDRLRKERPSDPEGVSALETAILAIRAEMAREKWKGKEFLAEPVDPWASISPAFQHVQKSKRSLSFSLPQNGHGACAFVVTNIADHAGRFTVSVEGKTKQLLSLALYQAPFVKGRKTRERTDPEFVADPLLPSSEAVHLRPGESRLFVLEAQGNQPGKWDGFVAITADSEIARLPVKGEVYPVALPETLSLNAVNWAYLTSKTIADRKRQIVADLFSHHVRVIVIHPVVLPRLGSRRPYDFKALNSNLALVRGASKVLLHMNFNEWAAGGMAKMRSMDKAWWDSFVTWYDGVISAAGEAGFSPKQVYLYPYDEMKNDDVGRFVLFATEARKKRPLMQFYATIDDKTGLAALPLLDIAQLHPPLSPSNCPAGGKPEIWLYDTRPGRAQPPHGYYRLMSWMAFSSGFKGVGFWDYSDFSGWSGRSGVVRQGLSEAGDIYGVVYEGEKGDLVSSRRWEAWRLGIEDYELLVMYAKMKGDNAAKALARAVLIHPEDTSKADEMKRRLIGELSGM